jgi:hypothetical protein
MGQQERALIFSLRAFLPVSSVNIPKNDKPLLKNNLGIPYG